MAAVFGVRQRGSRSACGVLAGSPSWTVPRMLVLVFGGGPGQVLVFLPFGLPRARENEQAAARPWAGRHFRGEGEVRAELH